MTDAFKNAAYSLVATAPSPATSGTSLVVTAGEGARFPAAPFNATIWPAADPFPIWGAGSATGGNFEIVRVTAVATNTLTITRAQETTTARTVIVGDRIAETLTQKTFDDLAFDPFGWGMALNFIPGAGYPVQVGPMESNRGYYFRFLNGKKGATGIRIRPVTSSGNISLQLWLNTGVGPAGLPGASIVATGAIACPAGGAQTVSLGGTYDFPPGSWGAMTCDNTTATFERMNAGINLQDMYAGLGGYADSRHPLSGSSPSLDGQGQPFVPLMAVV